MLIISAMKWNVNNHDDSWHYDLIIMRKFNAISFRTDEFFLEDISLYVTLFQQQIKKTNIEQKSFFSNEIKF